MRLTAHDRGFVLAPPGPVYERLKDPATYGTWWPGVRSRARGTELRIAIGGRPWVRAWTEGDRPGVGVVVRLGSRPAGTLEWYLEPLEDGTLVHAILDLELPGSRRASQRRLLRLRSVIRDGLVALRKETW